jgi:hypothetical protein
VLKNPRTWSKLTQEEKITILHARGALVIEATR